LLIKLAFIQEGLLLDVVVMSLILLKSLVFVDQTFYDLIQARHFRLDKHVPVTFPVQFEVVQRDETFYL
jgi:hypothetical protein